MLRHFPLIGSCVLAAALVVACGDDDDDSGIGSGGKSNGGATSGGHSGTGAKGGQSSSGGSSTHGGASSDGGTSAGGSTSTGGSESGGTTAEVSGGAGGESKGGSSSGGAQQGGTTSSSGGTTVVVTGGAAGSAGAGDTTGEGGSSGGPSAGAGGDATTTEGGAGGAPAVEADVIDNPGFEHGETRVTLPGWTIEGTADSSYVHYDTPGAYAGDGYLDNWLATAYTVTTSQVVAPLPNGNYSFTIWYTGGPYTNQYVFARGYDSGDSSVEMKTMTTASGTWTQLTVSPIPVTNGQVEIGVYSEAAAGNWSHFDDAVLTKLP